MDIVIETPRGSNAKFDFDPEKGKFELGKVLPVGLAFPYDFGYIAGTKGEDGDPLDVLVISEIQTFPGCLLNCRLIGGMKALQTSKEGETVRNDRFLAIPEASVQYAKIKSIGQLPADAKKQLLAFFEYYNEQEGRSFQLVQWLAAKSAQATVNQALQQSADPNYLIQLFLPLTEPTGQSYPASHFQRVKQQLAKNFGGVSVFGQSPVSGIWENNEGRQEKDELVVFEVMADALDPAYWKAFSKTLEKTFAQETIVIRSLAMGQL